jgi:hypothetical protein
MQHAKCLDSCIQRLKVMQGDLSNELESGQRRMITVWIRELKRMKKQPSPSQREIYRLVDEIATQLLTF